MVEGTHRVTLLTPDRQEGAGRWGGVGGEEETDESISKVKALVNQSLLSNNISC